MFNMLTSSTMDHEVEPWLEYKIVICCFSAKHAVLRRKSKGWLARNQENEFK